MRTALATLLTLEETVAPQVPTTEAGWWRLAVAAVRVGCAGLLLDVERKDHPRGPRSCLQRSAPLLRPAPLKGRWMRRTFILRARMDAWYSQTTVIFATPCFRAVCR